MHFKILQFIGSDNAKHRKQHTGSARATPRQGPAGRRLLKRRLLINFPKRNKQTTVQSLNARLSQPWLTPLALWEDVIACTDEMYLVYETKQTAVQEALRALVRQAGLSTDPDSLIFGPLKDPMRLYEKAYDDYAGRFPGLPTACVTDLLGARVICNDGMGMLNLLLMLLGLD